MTASPEERGVIRPGTARTGTPGMGNAGTLIGTEEIDGQRYARYRATPGTWVSASMREQGYGRLYNRERGYGAYTGIVRTSEGTPLENPDRVRTGEEYLVPVLRSRQPAPAPIPVPSPARASTLDAPGIPSNLVISEGFSATEVARGTRDRYSASQPAPAEQPLWALVGPVVSPAGRPAANALTRAALRLGGAEVLTGEAQVGAEATLTLGSLAAGAGLIAIALAGGYAGYYAWQEWETSEQAKVDARTLMRRARQGAHQLWQNGIITDEEYFLYLATGTLVVQPDRPAGRASSTVSEAQKKASDERWYYIMMLGNAYNRARMFDYPFNEVYVVGPDGVYYWLDATDLREIVSRKFTQFALVSVENGIRSVREIVEKYGPGTPIADVASSEGILKLTKVLKGRMILSVPVQRYPIPREVLEEAKRLGVTIRDDFGNEFILDQPQPTYENAPMQPKSTFIRPNAAPDSGAPDAGSGPGYIELTED